MTQERATFYKKDSISILKGEVTIRSRTGIKSYFSKTTSKRANSRKVETLPECLADSNRDLEVLAIVKDYHVPFLCQPHQKQILTKIKLWPKILRGGFIRDKTSWRSLY